MKRSIIVICAPLLFSLFSIAHEQLQENYENTISYSPTVKIHPPAVHFAIALPLFNLFLQGYYLIRRKDPDDTEFLATLISSIAVIGASATGYIVHESIENMPLRKEALEILHIHETIGIALAFLFSALALLRILFHFKPVKSLRYSYTALLVIGCIALLIQGNLGGNLVYKFGVGVEP